MAHDTPLARALSVIADVVEHDIDLYEVVCTRLVENDGLLIEQCYAIAANYVEDTASGSLWDEIHERLIAELRLDIAEGYVCSEEHAYLRIPLEAIPAARDHNAKHGHYPAHPFGPGQDQGFDDWAADIVASHVS